MARPALDRCPKCQGPLYSGYLFFSTFLRWCDTKPSRWHGLSGSLVAGSHWWLTFRNTEALQCPKCRLILLQPDDEGGRS
jgi:hypothetical protein